MLDYVVPYWKWFWARGVAKGRLGLHFGDGYPGLADDILICAPTYIDAGLLLDEFVIFLAQVGTTLNDDNTQLMLAIIPFNPGWFRNLHFRPKIERCHESC